MKIILKSVIIFCVVVIFTLCFIPFYENVYAYTNPHEISISSKEVEFGPAKISVMYKVIVNVERPSELDPGESFSIIVSPRNGIATYNIEVFGDTYSIPQNINLGNEAKFNIITGIDAYVSTSASSDVQILGPVNIKQQTLNWKNSSPQIIQSSVNDDVSNSDEVVVKIPIKINLDAGLNLHFLGVNQNLGEKNLGSISAYPVIEERIPINPSVVNSDIHLSSENLMWVFLIITITIIFIFIYKILEKKYNIDSLNVSSFSFSMIKEIKNSSEKKFNSVEKKINVDPKSYWVYAIKLKKSDNLIGNIIGNGDFTLYLTDREHFKEFQEKKKRGNMIFYEVGKSKSHSCDFYYTIPHSSEFLLVMYNGGKSTINLKLDYFVMNNS